jgi:predicted homoserine dehydrogenase-like protein
MQRSYRWIQLSSPTPRAFTVAAAGCEHVRDVANLLPSDQMIHTGLVDYTLGAAPHTGAFAIVHAESPLKKSAVRLLQTRQRSVLCVLHTVPFDSHPDRFDYQSSIYRFIHHDPTVAPIAGPMFEVVAVAKRDLKAGEDGDADFARMGLSIMLLQLAQWECGQ